MTTDDDFWHLKDSQSVGSQEELYALLQKSGHLKNISYNPDKLSPNPTDNPQQYQIRDTTFERVSFSKTCISGLTFRNCIFDRCLFIGATIEDCEFHDCKFKSSNTHKISITGTYINPVSFQDCLNKDKYQNIGVHLYQILLRNYRKIEQIEFEREAHFLFLRWKRFQDGYEIKEDWREKKNRVSCGFWCKCLGYVFRLVLWEKFFGWGLRLSNFTGTVFGVMTLFFVLNYSFRQEFGLEQGNEPISSCVEALYYTVISFTTLGYGDIVPTTSAGQIFASFQSLIGFCLLALLASMFSRRISP